jgi:DNA-binding beta-propeller fold protein YncE
VANTDSDDVTVWGTCGNTIAGTIDLGIGSVPDGIAVLPAADTVFVSNSALDSISVASGAILEVVKQIPTGPRPGAIAVNPATEHVYVCVRGNVPARAGELLVVDGAKRTRLKTIDLSATDPSAEPRGIAVNAVTSQAYVTLAGGQLVIIDTAQNQVTTAVPAPEPAGLDAVAVNPATNNVFVSSTVGERVFVFDADRAQWVQTLSVGPGWPRGIAVNPLTNQVVVSNPNADTVSLIEDHGSYQPFQQYLPLAIRH